MHGQIVYPRVLTPNGDGIGDRLLISLNLINVLEHRSLKLELFDLAGRRVRQISARALAGAQELVWDGRDQSGDLVPPGHYFLRAQSGKRRPQPERQPNGVDRLLESRRDVGIVELSVYPELERLGAIRLIAHCDAPNPRRLEWGDQADAPRTED